jgi:predicted amidohydrolase
MRIYLSRSYVRTLEYNMGALDAACTEGVVVGADIVVFPELFMTAYRGQNDPARFHERFVRISTEHSETLFIFGTISEAGYNRLNVYREGRVVAKYDKVHLFRPTGEHEKWKPGDKYVAVKFQGWRIGLMTCNDIRFPEQARALRMKAGADIFIVPAYWPDERDTTWATLLKARAIENGVYVVGCNVKGCDNGVENFTGAHSRVYDPGGGRLPSGRVYDMDKITRDQLLVDTDEQFVDIKKVETKDADRGK